MNKIYLLLTGLVFMLVMQSCSKKNHPTRAVNNPASSETTVTVPPTTTETLPDSTQLKKKDSIVVAKPIIRKKKETIPQVITVNDKFASKSVDGRYYYDLEGHRYWRSNKDGKYYLFNKSMLTDDDFKKPSQ